MVVVHELCHLKLFIEGTYVKLPGKGIVYLWNNEKAVDTLGILSGFGNTYLRASQYTLHNSEESGYITEKEFYFLYECFNKNRIFRTKSKTSKKIPWYKKLFSKFRP